MGLYQSDWKPSGIRSAWEKTGVGNDDAQQAIQRRYPLKEGVAVTDAVTWWRDDGSLAVMAADLTNGYRLIMRQQRRSTTVELVKVPA